MAKQFNPITGTLPEISIETVKKEFRKKDDWIVQEAPATPWFWWLSSVAWIHGLASEGYSPGSLLTYNSHNVGQLVVSKNRLVRLAKKLVRAELAGRSVMSSWIRRWKGYERRYLALVRQIRQRGLAGRSDSSLYELFQEFCTTYYYVETLPLANEFFIPYSDEIVATAMARDLKHARLLANLAVPRGLTFVQKEERELRSIGRLTPSKRQAAVRGHFAKWYFLNSGYDGSHSFTMKDMMRRFHRVFYTIPSTPAKISSQVSLDRKMASIFRLTRTIASWKDKRKMNNMIGCYHLDEFAHEFGRRYAISYQLITCASPRELPMIMAGWPGFRKELRIRQDTGVAWGLVGSRCSEIVTANQYARVRDAIHTIKQPKKILNGISAHPGLVTGRIKIIHHPQHERLRSGEILLTSMTRPDFVPLMKHAKAILCDEGGILSHAAIVSRELNIPCIVGLHHGMASLKDGDRVVVDAIRGMVKKI